MEKGRRVGRQHDDHASRFKLPASDAVTERGAKHLREMTDIVKAGGRAVMVYLVQRPDCRRFSVAADIDPGYAASLAAALTAGVEALCYGCRVAPDAITVAGPLTLDLPNPRHT